MYNITPDNSGAFLRVDLSAIKNNWRKMKEFLGDNKECAATLKTNAYGTGLKDVGKSLYEAGCNNFFVAHVFEGQELRQVVGDANIFVLHGIWEDSSSIFYENKLTPVLNSLEQIKLWSDFAKSKAETLDCILHFDTGMNRLGLSVADRDAIVENTSIVAGLNVKVIMSHLACADEPDHPKNKEQLAEFSVIEKSLQQVFPDAKRSLVSSAGIYLGKEYHYDLARPGIGLYGLGVPDVAGLELAVSLWGRVLQIHPTKVGETIGYGAAYKVHDNGQQVAVISVGYGDGFFRCLGLKGYRAFYNGTELLSVGKFSMDLLTLDVTPVAKDIKINDFVELMGQNISVKELADKAGTIEYELLTSLGARYYRKYI